MLIIRNNFQNIKSINYSIAIGNFDGIHQGHKFLIKELLRFKISNNDKVAILSFIPHPVKVIAPQIWEKNLVKFRTKYDKLKALGIDALLLISFSKTFSKISAEDFVKKYLMEKINAKNIIIGEDFRFGHKRKGDINLLSKYAKKKLSI